MVEFLVAMVYHLTYRTAEQNDPRILAELLPFIYHLHAKFYFVEQDLSDEHSIPYSEIIPILARGGYSIICRANMKETGVLLWLPTRFADSS